MQKIIFFIEQNINTHQSNEIGVQFVFEQNLNLFVQHHGYDPRISADILK